MIYTMNVSEEQLGTLGYNHHFNNTKNALEKSFGTCDLLLSTDTLQYRDYDQYEHGIFNKESKIRRHKTVFPHDCERAFKLGEGLTIQ